MEIAYLAIDTAPHPCYDLQGQDGGGLGHVAHRDLCPVGVVDQSLDQFPALGLLGVVHHAVQEGSGLSFKDV